MSVVPMRAPEFEYDAATFEDFWTLYPKRVAKLEAQKAWSRLSDAMRVEAVVGLVAWRSVWLAEGRMQFVPHAATWINGQRWQDELPEQWHAGHASHLPASLPSPSERVAMPQHVRDAIARLRK